MYCPKRCATKQDLDRHLRSHSGEANLVCQICNRTFVHRKTYTNHVRKHLGIKPYHCNLCNKNFGALNTLKKHQSSHQRKGDNTRIVTARRGNRDGPAISFIEIYEEAVPVREEVTVNKIQSAPIYIPGPHYIPQSGSSITPLCQMQVISDYTDVSRVNYDPPPPPSTLTSLQNSSELATDTPTEYNSEQRGGECIYSMNDTKKPKISFDYLEDADSRDDGYLLGLFGPQPSNTETTLDKL